MRSWALKGSMLYLPNYTRKKVCSIEAQYSTDTITGIRKNTSP